MVAIRQPYLKTHAVVLQVDPVTNTSARVEWLSHDVGRFTSRIQGAYRPKSFFMGQFDVFYTCEVVLQQSRSGYYAVRECYPVEKRLELRKNWRSMAAASYFSSILNQWLPYRAPSPDGFALLNQLLDTCALYTGSRSLIYWGELKLLKAAGWSPNFEKRISDKAFDLSSGKYGTKRAHQHSSGEQIQVSPDAAALLNRFQGARDYDSLLTLKLQPSQENIIERLLGGFLQYQLEVHLPARNIALDCVGRKFTATA